MRLASIVLTQNADNLSDKKRWQACQAVARDYPALGYLHTHQTVGRGSGESPHNKLFVETASLWEQYQVILESRPRQYGALLGLLTQVDKDLNRIVSDYPESSLAVELASSRSVNGIDIVKINEEIIRLKDSIDKKNIEISQRLNSTIQIKEPAKRCIALTGIAVDQVHYIGDESGARDTMSKALEAALDIDDVTSRINSVNHVATVQHNIGDESGARDTMSKALDISLGIEDELERILYLMATAENQNSIGDASGARVTFSKAIEVAYANEDEKMRVLELRTIARSQNIIGDASGAQATLSKALEIEKSVSKSE